MNDYSKYTCDLCGWFPVVSSPYIDDMRFRLIYVCRICFFDDVISHLRNPTTNEIEMFEVIRQ
jgi:hypothetical protein